MDRYWKKPEVCGNWISPFTEISQSILQRWENAPFPCCHKCKGYKARTEVLQVAEESDGRGGNRVPMFSVSRGVPRSGEQVEADKWAGDSAVIVGSQRAPLLSVGVLFCAKGGNFGKGTKAHYIMRRSDHKYLCSGRHSSCLEPSELSEDLVLTALDFYLFLAIQVVNKALKYIQICWLWGTISVKPKRAMKYPGFDFLPVKDH